MYSYFTGTFQSPAVTAQECVSWVCMQQTKTHTAWVSCSIHFSHFYIFHQGILCCEIFFPFLLGQFGTKHPRTIPVDILGFRNDLLISRVTQINKDCTQSIQNTCALALRHSFSSSDWTKFKSTRQSSAGLWARLFVNSSINLEGTTLTLKGTTLILEGTTVGLEEQYSKFQVSLQCLAISILCLCPISFCCYWCCPRLANTKQ